MMKMQIKLTFKTVVLLFSCFTFFLETAKATSYYVRTDGNNNNNGLSNTPTGAWKSVNDALYGYCNWGAGPTGQGVPMLPGDTLFVNDGVYVEDGYGYGLKIDGVAGSNTNRFFLKSINKWGAKLELSSAYNSFNIMNSKGVTIDGFDIYNAPTSTNIHSGVVVNYPSEFVTIRNCKIHNFGLSAIAGDGSNIIVENNEVYDNSIRNAGNGSGINFYHPKKVSTNTLAGGYGHIIRGNRVYNNYCNLFYTNVMGVYSPPTDGNGIIIDDWNFTQNSSGVPYKVPCLIENNICFKNGGSGIRVYDSDNVVVRNNTCYYNSWVTSNYPSGSGDYPSGDIGVTCEAGKGNNIKVINNICITDPSITNSNFGIGIGNATTNVTVTNNYTNLLFFTAGGSANIIGNAPQFVNASVNPTTANFRLSASSPAINIGLNSNAANIDFVGVLRPQNGTVDAGAYEYVGAIAPVISGSNSICAGTTTTYTTSIAGGTWSSSATNIATVTSTGLITGISAGTATISYTLNAAAATKSITINALPNAGTISAAASICRGTTTSATSSVVAGTWAITPSNVATISATGLITGVSAGTATISYTVTTNGCSTTTTKAITINALPSAGIISASASLCAGATTTATSSVAAGTWSITPSTIATISTTGLITGVSAGNATISYTVTTNGCSSTTIKAITINALPSAGTISALSSICVGATTTATSSVAAGTWSISPSTVATISATGLITGVSAGTATISYTVTANGCSSSATKSITINALPSAGTISAVSSLCAGATTTATSSVAAGTWSITPITVATISGTGLITGVSAGTATISYTVTTNGCSTTTTKAITINALPSAGTISAAASLCAGATTTVTSSVTSGTWSITPSTVATISGTGLITGVSAGTATISYTVTANGCSTTTTKAITIHALPSAGAISAAASLCAGATTSATSSVAAGTWAITPSTVATISTTGLITGVSAGTATISYTVTTNGCSTTTTKAITIHALPSAGTISAVSSLCAGATTTATSSVAAGTWSITPSTVATISTTGLITGVSAGTATISYTVTTNGCSTTTTKAITINAAVAAPTFSVASGVLTSAANVSLATTTSGSSIRYTVDNSIPTPSLGNIYSSAINVNKTQTIKAIAYTSSTCKSAISSATYTFYTPIIVRARSVSVSGASMRVDVMGSSSTTGTTIIESKTFNNLGTSFANYTFNATSVINPQLIRVNYINDAAAFDLEVDYIKINTLTYQTEAPTTYGVGVWANGNCNTGGFFTSSIIHCNGYFHYQASTALLSHSSSVIKGNQNALLTIYPNPTSHTLILNDVNYKAQKITILNINGQVVKQIEEVGNEIDVEYLQNGIYFLQVESENQSKEIIRFVKI